MASSRALVENDAWQTWARRVLRLTAPVRPDTGVLVVGLDDPASRR